MSGLRSRIWYCVFTLLGLITQTRAQVEYKEPVVLGEYEVAAFHRIFGTSDSQREAVRLLLDAAKQRMLAEEAEAGRRAEEYMRLPKESKTKQLRQEVINRTESARDKIARMREEALADLRALLTEGQLERWKRFEYFRTRERVLYGDPNLGIDRTNLLALVESLSIRPDSYPPLAELLETYERELDTLLLEIEKAGAEVHRALREQRDPAKPQAAFFELAKRLGQYHFQYVRRMAVMLPEERAAALRELYDRVSLSDAYGVNGVDAGVRVAADLSGLEEGVRESVRKVVREYAPKYDELTRRIAAMEKGLRMRDPSEENVDMTDWDSVRMERARILNEAQLAIQKSLTPEQMEQMFAAGRRVEREWRDKMTR